jgi:hypothetical protein
MHVLQRMQFGWTQGWILVEMVGKKLGSTSLACIVHV